MQVNIIEDLISKDKIPDAFKYLLAHVNGSSDYDSLKEALLIKKNLYTKIELDNIKGLIDNDTYFRQRSKITHVLLSVTHEIYSIERVEDEIQDTDSETNQLFNELKKLKDRVSKIEKMLKVIEEKTELELSNELKTEDKNTIGPNDDEVNRKLKLTKQNLTIEDPRVNYVFVFGRPGVGKTTILASIFKYLYDNYQLKYNSIGNKEGIKYLHHLLESLRKQDFPKTTGIENIEEIDLSIDDPESGLSTIITFLDISGENLHQIQPHHKKVRNHSINFDTFFKEKESINFLLVTTPISTNEDDLILTNFINYLSDKYQYTKLNIGLIVNKWDLMDESRKDDLPEFVKKDLPLTFHSISQKNINPTVFKFSALDAEYHNISLVVKYLLEDFKTTPNNVQSTIASIRRLLRLH